MMNYQQIYEENKSEIIRFLHSIGYNPHKLVEEASKDNMDVYEYINILYELK